MASGWFFFLQRGVLEWGLSCSSSWGHHSICIAWGHEANQPKHVQNTVNFKHNYKVVCFHPGLSGCILNLTVPIKKKKFLSSMLTWRPLAILYSAGTWLDVMGTESTCRHFFHLSAWGCESSLPAGLAPAWVKLLAAVWWAELLGCFPGEGCWAQSAAGEPGIYRASSWQLHVTCGKVLGRM